MKLLPLLLSISSLTLAAKPLPLDRILQSARELDSILSTAQQAQGIKANPIINDSTFLRRSYLNIIGRLPTHQEAQQFLQNTSPHKRRELIDTLITSPGFHSQLFNFWADLLRLKTRQDHHGLGWHVWLKNAITQNTPYDEIVRKMLSAKGHTAEDPAVGYYLRDRGMLLDNISNSAQIFLGQQIGCAQCHDHPFDDTTQLEYYQLAAFLGGTEYRFGGARDKIREILSTDSPPEKKPQPRKNRKNSAKQARNKRAQARDLASIFRNHQRNAITDRPTKNLKLPADYRYSDATAGDSVKPNFLFDLHTGSIPPEKRRSHFAHWVSSPKNPYFTKTISNRLWKYTFGYGLIPEVDNLSNSASSHYPELVAAIEKTMRSTGYDLQQYLRILYHTQLFQREISTQEPSPGFAFHFQGPTLRRLSAQEIRDTFATLASGNIDSNRNTSFEQAWEKYRHSFNFLMASNLTQLTEINEDIQQVEAQRRSAQKQASLLRTQLREAKENGDSSQLRKLTLELRGLRKRNQKKSQPDSPPSEVVTKARAAISRRPPSIRPEHPDFQMRSSELPAPQGGGSFIAEFGGSDAESPSSAHTKATVPQVLRLLNGPETSLLTKRKNLFASQLKTLSSPEERLDFLFLSLYSALPTQSEKEKFLPETKTPESTATLARAILTSNRFLFIQ